MNSYKKVEQRWYRRYLKKESNKDIEMSVQETAENMNKEQEMCPASIQFGVPDWDASDTPCLCDFCVELRRTRREDTSNLRGRK